MTETAVKERPILFSGEMVRAILDGRKTQTRRAFGVRGFLNGITEFGPSGTPGYDWHFRDSRRLWQDFRHSEIVERCPYGIPGDRLWVREAWMPWFEDISTDGIAHCIRYRSDQSFMFAKDMDVANQIELMIDPEIGVVDKWRPSIHMPRWASRITLEITDVRVQRLQDISEEDAIAEGCQCAGVPASLTNRGAFAKLWNSINGDGSWESNPWVWAVSFHKLENEQ